MIEAVIFDYNWTLVQGDVAPAQFYPETLQVLQYLQDLGIKMAVVSVGGTDPAARFKEFEQLGLKKYISVFRVVGAGQPKELKPVLEELEVEAKNCVVVGDRIKKEILEGNKIGATTVWLRQGKFAEEKPETAQEQPDYTITSLDQLIPIIDSLR